MNSIHDVIIAGAGPAGTSAAIHLALNKARVLLVEQQLFPRPKLCGEFVSPECIPHFERLGVIDHMLSSGSARLAKTVFYSQTGRSVSVPSSWFSSGENALGLSRSQMDHLLLQRAKEVGVSVVEGTEATIILSEGRKVSGVRLRQGTETTSHSAAITIDATGRKRALIRRLPQNGGQVRLKTKRTLVAFKAHLENAHLANGACEIYVYPGGYGGLNNIENQLSNLCFIVSSEVVRRWDSDPETVMRQTVLRNARAAQTLSSARVVSEWLSVSLERFGRERLVPAEGLLTVGDAAAFIDPFTGSGILMALESGEVISQCISSNLHRFGEADSFERVAEDYRNAYVKNFESRLRASGLLRRAAFMPWVAEAAILFFGLSDNLRWLMARATRCGKVL